MTDAGHTYRVRVLPREAAIELALDLPAGAHRLDTVTWVPGAYAFLRYGRDVVDVRASGARSGRPLAVRRDGLAGFQVAASDEPVRVTARASMADPAWAELAGYVASEHAVVHATRFLRAASVPGPVRVTWEAPPGWALHHPGGSVRESVTGDGVDAPRVETHLYPSFAALLDTPVVFGAHTRREREERDEGRPVAFHHVFLDRAVGMDTELDAFVDDVQKLARACRDLFGGFPFDDYTFVWSFDPRAHWGLEHAHATLVGVGPLALVEPEARFAALRVAVHELVHAWNVCRLKPRALVDADLAAGSFPDELWIAEGFTRYYELVLTARAGLTSPARVLSNLANYWRALTARPGYRRASLVDSSHATFSNHHRFPNAANVAIDYYDGGMLAAFELDAHLRARPDAPASLDAAFRALWASHGESPTGYDQADAVAAFGRFGDDAAALARRVSETPGGLDTPAALRALGLVVELADVPTAGLVLDADRVVHVLEGGPAAAAGICPDDRLVLADGVAFKPEGFAWLVRHRAAFDVVVRRGDLQLARRIAPGLRPDLVRLRLPAEPAAAAVRARLAAWLGAAAEELPAGVDLPLTFYDNFHGTERVT